MSVVLITGTSSGIGLATAVELAHRGERVFASMRDTSRSEALREAAASAGIEVEVVQLDVTDTDSVERAVAQVLAGAGAIDVLVNNAGGSPPMPALRTSEKMFEAALRFNVTSAFLMSRLVIPHMQEGHGGSIVNISSAAGRLPQAQFVAYGTAKAALSFMTRQLAAEFAPLVRVNAVAVGATATSSLLPFLNDDTRAAMEQRTPMRRIGTVEDISIAVLYLASAASSWVTGKVLEVDGGTESTNWPFD